MDIISIFANICLDSQWWIKLRFLFPSYLYITSNMWTYLVAIPFSVAFEASMTRLPPPINQPTWLCSLERISSWDERGGHTHWWLLSFWIWQWRKWLLTTVTLDQDMELQMTRGFFFKNWLPQGRLQKKRQREWHWSFLCKTPLP